MAGECIQSAWLHYTSPCMHWIYRIKQAPQTPSCTCPISNNTPFRTDMCTFLFWMMFCRIWDGCIVGYLRGVYLGPPTRRSARWPNCCTKHNFDIWYSSSRKKYNKLISGFRTSLESLQWRHNERDDVSNHQPHNCLLNHLFRHRSNKTSKPPRHWPLCGEFTGHRWIPSTQRASNAENVFLWWRHHVQFIYNVRTVICMLCNCRDTIVTLEPVLLLLIIPPLHRGCDLCASLVRPCLGRSRVAHRTFRHRHGRHGRHEVLSMFKTVAQSSPRRSVAHKSLKGGRMKAHTCCGRRMDAQWSAIGRAVNNANIVYQCERHVCFPCTTTVPPLADQWRPLSDH